MIQLPDEFDSVFRYIVVVSQRAEQLINGAKARVESRHAKPTLQARDDVEAGAVEWRVLTQEELDAQRQAMVEQFRAEIDAAGEAQARQIPDVLPTAGAAPDSASRDADDEDRDDELDRLQRLLGMVREADEDDDEDEEDEEDDDDVSLDLEDDDEDGTLDLEESD